jgi:hypothetical protein
VANENPLKYIEQLEEMFATDGWRNLVDEAKSQIYQYQCDCFQSRTWEEFVELRGRVAQLSSVVNLEEVTKLMKANYLAELEADEDADL